MRVREIEIERRRLVRRAGLLLMIIPTRVSNIGLLLGLGFAVHGVSPPKPAKDIHSERVSAAPLEPTAPTEMRGNVMSCHVGSPDHQSSLAWASRGL